MCPDYGDTPWYSDLQLFNPSSKKMCLDNGDGVVDSPRYCEDLNPTSKKIHLQYNDDVVETP